MTILPQAGDGCDLPALIQNVSKVSDTLEIFGVMYPDHDRRCLNFTGDFSLVRHIPLRS